jgi:phosphate transport system permease protein
MTEAALAPAARQATPFELDQKRIARRYAAERRFRAFGLAAIALTAVFIAVVIVDIVGKGLPAFWQHSLTIDIPVSAEAVDPSGTRDPAKMATEGDFAVPIREALSAVFPGNTSRAQRRLLTGIVSTGASEQLRERVMADPRLVGTTVRMSVLLSDDSDLYFKGQETESSTIAGATALTVSGTAGEVKLSAVAASAFAPALAAAGLPSTGAVALDSSKPSVLVAVNGGIVKLTTVEGSAATGTTLLPLKSDGAVKAGDWRIVTFMTPEANRRIGDQQAAWLDALKTSGQVERHFAWRLFTAGDSREPELAGIRGAIIGSALTLLVTLALCLPLGVAAAVYLEEFAPKNRLTEIVEVNINNLAAVPSIVFGLLGLAMFLNFFGLPRSAPLVGGLVLALLVLPTIIIASRAALKAVPPSIKEAALGVGASHQQAVFHHVLPVAMPGIMTGTIIGMAHALGETAPLLMIGMVAFIVDIPSGLTQAATVLPVQIYLWSDLPEQAFQAKTAAAIMVLLVFLFIMNGLAIVLRRRFERRW